MRFRINVISQWGILNHTNLILFMKNVLEMKYEQDEFSNITIFLQTPNQEFVKHFHVISCF